MRIDFLKVFKMYLIRKLVTRKCKIVLKRVFKIKPLILVVLLIHVSAMYMIISRTHQRSIQMSLVVSHDRDFLINTEGCKIPKMNPYDPSIEAYLDEGSELKCDEEEELVYAKNKNIYINWDVAKRSFPALRHCKYEVIWRPPNEARDHNFYVFVNESDKFINATLINDEFIRVRCFDKNHTVIYTNVFSFVQPKVDVEKRCTEKFKQFSKDKTDTLSILMLGVDSVSRSNMIRYMPKTRDYLLQNMSAFELIGYNKVEDNTFVNIVPMTTGKYVEELPWLENMTDEPFDKYEFIWNKYSNHGYRTLLIEDDPYLQMFDYLKAGFAKYPTDYFNRPFSVAAEDIPDIWNAEHYCIHARPEANVVLDYLGQFMSEFNARPYFALTFLTRLTHEYLSGARMTDLIYLNFFKNINMAGTMNKTIIFFFSDHGVRYGKVRLTSVGRLEERLPFMYVILPRWFLHKYPNIQRNLQLNSRRLSTPFDIFQTLVSLLDFKPLTKNRSTERGMSILKEIPTNRTCEMAGILPHWCTCSQHMVLSTTDKDAVYIAKRFVEEINSKLVNVSQCANLSIGEIKSASKFITSDKVLSFNLGAYGKRVDTYVDYELTIRTTPGNAIFEGTLRYDEGTKAVQMIGDISRINKYGAQSHCVDEANKKKFCFCIDQM